MDHQATNERTTVMQVTGSGQVFLANQGMDIQVMYLEDDAMYCNGASVLDRPPGRCRRHVPPTFTR